MPPDHSAHIYAGLSVSCTPIVWFANTLPVIQWIATLVAILSGAIAIYKFVRDKKN